MKVIYTFSHHEFSPDLIISQLALLASTAMPLKCLCSFLLALFNSLYSNPLHHPYRIHLKVHSPSMSSYLYIFCIQRSAPTTTSAHERASSRTDPSAPAERSLPVTLPPRLLERTRTCS
jgi:hypothetical protein